MKQTNSRCTVQDVSAELASLRQKKRFYLVMIAAGVIALFGGILAGMFFFVPIGFALCILSGVLLAKNEKRMKEVVGAPIIRSVLKEVFEHVEYSMFERLPDHLLEVNEMDFPFDIDRIEGSDYIRATYHGVQIEMSDIKLIDRQSSGKHTRYVTQFEGLWMICDFGKTLSADLLLRERQSKLFRFAENLFRSDDTIETENEEFNDKFIIRSDSEHDAFYILTPHMMEYILQMDRKSAGDTYLRFMRSGKVHIAINSGRDSFEMESGDDPGLLKQRFVSEIRYITDLIDELRLADTSHKS